jgi:hypothetical protein
VILDSEILRKHPELAILDLCAQAAETAIVALCAVHPAIEHELRDDPEPPLQRLADLIVEHASAMLDALDRYRPLPHDPDPLRSRSAIDDNSIF